MKKIVVYCISFLLLVASFGGVFSEEVFAAARFPDVPEDHWAYTCIEACAQAGIIEGYPQEDGGWIFLPEKNVTKTEAVKMVAETVWRAKIGYSRKDYTDKWELVLQDASIAEWAYSYVAFALEEGLLLTTELPGFFTDPQDPFSDAPASRQEVFTWLGRALWSTYRTSEDKVFALHYLDVADAGDSALPYLALLTNLKVLEGYVREDGTAVLLPRNTITRAEFAKICSVAYQLPSRQRALSETAFSYQGLISQISLGTSYPFSRYGSFVVTGSDRVPHRVYVTDALPYVFYDGEPLEDGITAMAEGYTGLVSWGESGQLHVDFSMARGTGRVKTVGALDRASGYRPITLTLENGVDAVYYWNSSLSVGKTVSFLADGIFLVEVK